MHNFLNDKLPLSFAETWKKNRERNLNVNLRNADDLYVPPHRIEVVKRLPLCSFPSTWNAVPDFKVNPALKKFVVDMKSHLQ